MKRLILALVLILALSSTAFARLPQKGDNVFIATSGGAHYHGIITDIENGFLCLQAATSHWDSNTQKNIEETYDVCVGIGSISDLTWNN
jgi:hypothetical protein